MRLALADRFWAKVDRDGALPAHRPDLGPCWIWTAWINNGGYGGIQVGGVPKLAHRIAYELAGGTIAKGLTIDHLCRVRRCVRPDHLEPVTMGTNTMRGDTIIAAAAKKTHCPRGHPLEGENLLADLLRRKGWRSCRTCQNATMRDYYHRRKHGIVLQTAALL